MEAQLHKSMVGGAAGKLLRKHFNKRRNEMVKRRSNKRQLALQVLVWVSTTIRALRRALAWED